MKRGGSTVREASVRAALAAAATAAVVFGVLACSVDLDLPERYAIVYGVEAYTATYDSDPDVNPNPNLDFCADDAQAVHSLLLAKGYVPAGTILRLDSAATKAQLEADFAHLAAAAKRDSSFVFFFSGHGTVKAGVEGDAEPSGQNAYTEYLVPYGGMDPASMTSYSVIVQENLVSDDELMRLLASVPSRNKIVILDACYTGGFIGDSPAADSSPESYDGTNREGAASAAAEAFANYFANTDAGDVLYTEAVVLAAAGESESSYEVEEYGGRIYNHGLFTYYLLKSPARGDRNGDGLVTAVEAFSYARDRIAESWDFLPRISGGALDFVLFEAD